MPKNKGELHGNTQALWLSRTTYLWRRHHAELPSVFSGLKPLWQHPASNFTSGLASQSQMALPGGAEADCTSLPSEACTTMAAIAGKGGKNRRRGKNESEEKRELIFKEDGQGERYVPGRTSRRCVCVLAINAKDFCAEDGRSFLHCRVCTGAADVGQWAFRSTVHRWHQAALSYPRQDAKEGLGEHGESDLLVLEARFDRTTAHASFDGSARWRGAASWSDFFQFVVWPPQGDIILVGLRDYQDEKADVILK